MWRVWHEAHRSEIPSQPTLFFLPMIPCVLWSKRTSCLGFSSVTLNYGILTGFSLHLLVSRSKCSKPCSWTYYFFCVEQNPSSLHMVQGKESQTFVGWRNGEGNGDRFSWLCLCLQPSLPSLWREMKSSHGVTGGIKGCVAKCGSCRHPGNSSADSGEESRISSQLRSFSHINWGLHAPIQVSFHRRTMVSGFCLAFIGDSEDMKGKADLLCIPSASELCPCELFTNH